VLTLASIILAFFTLPPYISAPFAIMCVLVSWLANRLVYKYHQILIHAGVDLLEEKNLRLGFLWGKSEMKGKLYPELNILYENERAAKLAYEILRTWNFGSIVDLKGNIEISFIEEKGTKYSIFLYPGERKRLRNIAEILTIKGLPSNSEVESIEMKPFFHNCADYLNTPDMIEFFNTIRKVGILFLNTAYVKNDRPVEYAKRCIKLTKMNFLERRELTPDKIEYHYKWFDTKTTAPNLVKRVSEIKF
jgi:hypothetical protein